MKIVGILERIDWPFQIGYNRDEGLRRWGVHPAYGRAAVMPRGAKS